ncbi:hypothetical protein CEUSTIGMA_g885.t1, partial [Chlamydomonas eustigma]
PFYISYREAIGADSGLISMYSNKVSIHMFNGTQGIVGSYHSFLQAILNPGQSYVDTQYSNSRYTFVSLSGSTAMVSVCRFISSASECTEPAPPPSPPHPPMHPNPLPPPPSIKASQPSPPPPPSPLPPKPLNLSPPPSMTPPPAVSRPPFGAPTVTHQIWVNTPITTPFGKTNANVAVATVTQVICPDMYLAISQALIQMGLNPATVIVGSAKYNGCAAVSPLPSASRYVRVANKFYLAISTADYLTLQAKLYTASFIQSGHILCGSTVYFQAYPSNANVPATDATTSPMTHLKEPSWLGKAGMGSVCWTDVLATTI